MPPIKSLEKEIASRQNSRDYAGFNMYLPNPDSVLKKQGKDIEVYKELHSDAHVGADVLKRKAGVRSLEWELSGDDTPVKKFIQECFDALDMYAIITEMLEAPLYGYQPMEVIWEKRGGYIAPKKVEGKPPEWFRYSTENELLFLSKEAWQGEAVPDFKFIVARNEPTYQNPYGKAALSACFWPVVFKRGGMKFWVTFTEKYGMPFLIGKYARGTSQDEIDKLVISLDDMIQDAVAAIPDDSSVEIKEAGGKGSSADIYEKMLQFYNAEISKAIVGQTLTTEVGSNGSYAASKTHSEVLKDVVGSDARMVESAMNQLIRWIVQLNFAGEKAPKFIMYEEQDVDQALADRDGKLVSGGVRFTKTYYKRAYGFKDDEIDVTDPASTPAMGEYRFSEKPADALDAASPADKTKSAEDEIFLALQKAIDGAETYEEAFDALLGLYPDLDLGVLQSSLQRLCANAMILGGAEVDDERRV